WAHLMIDGRYLQWWSSVAFNRSDFYDIFGPTQRSRKGFAAKGGHEHFLVYDDPLRLEWVNELAFYDRIDTLPQAQNVPTSFDRLFEGSTGLRYTDIQRSRGAADDLKGIKWSALAGFSQAAGETAWNLLGTIDYGWTLPLAGSSLWLRNAVGWIDGDRQLANANFYFGSFGNNYLDGGTVRRYRDSSKLPGFGIDAISAQSFVRTLVEWNVTPLVFESAGTPAFHLAWLRPALFATALWTDPNRSASRALYGNVGGQLDLRFSVLHWYETTLSVGYAVGFLEGGQRSSEWMVSLKIM
nr:hypothetical protein [Burkholderiaceae bacterium]